MYITCSATNPVDVRQPHAQRNQRHSDLPHARYEWRLMLRKLFPAHDPSELISRRLLIQSHQLPRIIKHVEECNSQAVCRCYPYQNGYGVNCGYEEQISTGYFFVLNSTAYSYSYQPPSVQPTTCTEYDSKDGRPTRNSQTLPSHIALR